MGYFYHCCPCKEVCPFLAGDDIQRSSKKKELDKLRQSYIQDKDLVVIAMWEYEWWRLYKTTSNVNMYIQEIFPLDDLLQNTNSWKD